MLYISIIDYTLYVEVGCKMNNDHCLLVAELKKKENERAKCNNQILQNKLPNNNKQI